MAQVEEHRAVRMSCAVGKHGQREVVQAVVLQLQLLQVRQGDERPPVDAGDLVVGQDERDEVGQVPEGAHLDVPQSVPGQHDRLQLLKTGELAHAQQSQPVEGEPDVPQVLVDVLVQQVGRDRRQLVCLQVQVLQLAQVVEAGLADLPDVVVVQGEPEQLLQRLQGGLREDPHGQAKTDLEALKGAPDVFEREAVKGVEVVKGKAQFSQLRAALESVRLKLGQPVVPEKIVSEKVDLISWKFIFTRVIAVVHQMRDTNNTISRS